MILHLHILLLLLSFSTILFSQNEELQKLLDRREFEKCLKRCDAITNKDPDNLDAHYYRALVYFEMAQAPERWTAVVTSPLEKSLSSINRIRLKSDGASYLAERKETISIIQKYAEEFAKELALRNRTQAIRMYRLIMRINSSKENALELAEIYWRMGDLNQCFFEIDNLYGYYKIDSTGQGKQGKTDALVEAPWFLISKWMFNDLFQIAQKHNRKFPPETEIGGELYKAVITTIDTLYSNPEKDDFFEFSRRALDIYANREEIRSRITRQCMDLCRNTASDFSKVKNKTWRDTIMLRNAFKYADMSFQLTKDSVFYNFEKLLINRYFVAIPEKLVKTFAEVSTQVINKIRSKDYECKLGLAYSTDSVQWHPSLFEQAAIHAREMYAYNYTDTKDKKGLTPRERISATELNPEILNTLGGFIFFGATKVAEAVSYGYTLKDVETAYDLKVLIEKVFDKWMKGDDIDCRKIMDGDFTHFGLYVFGDRWSLMMAKVMYIRDK